MGISSAIFELAHAVPLRTGGWLEFCTVFLAQVTLKPPLQFPVWFSLKPSEHQMTLERQFECNYILTTTCRPGKTGATTAVSSQQTNGLSPQRTVESRLGAAPAQVPVTGAGRRGSPVPLRATALLLPPPAPHPLASQAVPFS